MQTNASCTAVAEYETNSIAFVDTSRMAVAHRVDTPGRPVAIAVTNDGLTAIAALNTGAVLSLDVPTRAISLLFQAGFPLSDAALAPDDRWIVAVSKQSGVLTLFERATGRSWSEDVSCKGECVPGAVAITADSRYALVANQGYQEEYPPPIFVSVDLRELRLYTPGFPCGDCCKAGCCGSPAIINPRDIATSDGNDAVVTVSSALGLVVNRRSGKPVHVIEPSTGDTCFNRGAFADGNALARDVDGKMYITGVREQIRNGPDVLHRGIQGVFIYDPSQQWKKIDEYNLGFVGSSLVVAGNNIIVTDPEGGLIVVNRASHVVNRIAVGTAAAAPAMVGNEGCRTDQPAPTPSVPNACAGDCSNDARVTIDELVTGVNIALGAVSIDVCPELDSDGDQRVSIHEIVAGTRNALRGCR